MPRQALLRRISFYADLDDADQQVIMQINGREQHYEKNTEIVDAGQELDSVLIVKEGWAIRYGSPALGSDCGRSRSFGKNGDQPDRLVGPPV